MAGNVNKVLLMGNMTRDIEMRQFPSGGSVGKFTLAVNERYKDRNEQWQERANFIDCEVFGRKAEVMAQYLGKGRPVFIEGKLRLDKWEDKQSGENRSKLKVVVDDFQFVDSRGDGPSGGGRSSGGSNYSSSPSSSDNSGYGGNQQPSPAYESLDDDDIPF
ncbi:MAG: single-stranded DNA-binding protein [Phycisphaerales bacterium JB065]